MIDCRNLAEVMEHHGPHEATSKADLWAPAGTALPRGTVTCTRVHVRAGALVQPED